jgi:hypothetical protein
MFTKQVITILGYYVNLCNLLDSLTLNYIQQTNKTMYKFHEDAGHGWLEVPLAEVIESGIEVSGYSYKRGGTAYLEEDLDAGLFMDAMGLNNSDIEEVDDGDYSPIRNYARF